MGFINYLVTVVVQFLPFTGNDGGLINQQPIPIDVPSSGVSFSPEIGSDIVSDVSYKESKITCHYPSLRGWELCNGPDSRNCWLRDKHSRQPIFSEFDITTDYEDLWPQGVTREYWIEVSEKTISPDGTPKLSQLLNGTYPGPLIEACWGDDIVVHVTDKLADNGTTIHWHGVRQLNTNDADGVNGVTQCPIAGDKTYTYKFKATQYGHSWYHSHYSLQYPNGVAGPLLIHGPTSANWDVELDPIMMADWFNANAFAAFHTELVQPPPHSDSVLLGGIGRNSGSIFTRVVQTGKKVLLHLINASTDMHFVFSIDGHPLQVITTDFVPIQPYWTDSISIGIGQRYSVIIETNQTVGNYWIRTTPVSGCSGNGTVQDDRTGILRYQNAPKANPTSSINPGLTFACADEPAEKLKPVVRWEVGTNPANDVFDSTYEVGVVASRNATRWAIGEKSLWIDFSDPTILDVNNRTFNPDYDVERYDFKNEWIYIIITASGNITGVPNPPGRNLTLPLVHPIHLHGHDFAILGVGDGTYNELSDPFGFKYHNPPRRDVALLPIGGWLAIAFKSDNPGVWLLHCHIAWHASSGLALQILERTGDIEKALGRKRLTAVEQTCKEWKEWDLSKTIGQDQEDSGV